MVHWISEELRLGILRGPEDEREAELVDLGERTLAGLNGSFLVAASLTVPPPPRSRSLLPPSLQPSTPEDPAGESDGSADMEIWSGDEAS